jgi:hypothetical protein
MGRSYQPSHGLLRGPDARGNVFALDVSGVLCLGIDLFVDFVGFSFRVFRGVFFVSSSCLRVFVVNCAA